MLFQFIMTNSGPPKLDQISQSFEFKVPTMSDMNASVQDTKGSLYDSEVRRIQAPLRAWNVD